MSQDSLLRALVQNLPVTDVIKASITDIDLYRRPGNLKTLFISYLGNLNLPIEVGAEFLNFAHEVATAEKGKDVAGLVAEIVEAVCSGLKQVSLESADLNASNWVDAVKRTIDGDSVETLMALDQAGLIDRSSSGVEGMMHQFWREAIMSNAARCNRYLLTTTGVNVLAGFPQSKGTWPKNMEMARDVVIHVPQEELQEVLDIMLESSQAQWDKDRIKDEAEHVVAALLERCSESVQLMSLPAFETLLSRMIRHTVTAENTRLDDPLVARAMLEVIDRRQILGGRAGFRYVQKLLQDDQDGELMAPAYLEELISKGLRIEWGHKEGAGVKKVHLLAVASHCHFAVLDKQVPDKEAFMRYFGPDFIRRRVATHHGPESDAPMLGAQNRDLMALAEMGYPFGPIAVMDKEGNEETLSLYERIYSASGGMDAFIVGHVCGHLDCDKTLNGVGPVHLAVGRGNIPSVEALARKGYSLEQPCPKRINDSFNATNLYGMDDCMPLIIALKKQNNEMLKALVDLGADVGAIAPTGATAMRLARSDYAKALIRSARTSQVLSKSIDGAIDAPSGQPVASKKKSTGVAPL